MTVWTGLRRLLLIAALATLLSVPSTALGGGSLPRMTAPVAKHLAAKAFKRDDQGLLYAYSNHKRITGCKSVSRPRMRCKAKWRLAQSTTDLRYSGHVTIWFSKNKRGDLLWNYAYDIKSVDGICQQNADPRFDCVQHYHVN